MQWNFMTKLLKVDIFIMNLNDEYKNDILKMTWETTLTWMANRMKNIWLNCMEWMKYDKNLTIYLES